MIDAKKREARRARNSAGLQGHRNRLYVDEATLDRENFEYRFVNNEPGRIEAYAKNEWELVSDRDGAMKTDSAGVGTEVSAHAGIGLTGAPLKTVLMRLPKPYYVDDQAAKQARIDATEAGLKAGQAEGAGVENGYVKPGGISMKAVAG